MAEEEENLEDISVANPDGYGIDQEFVPTAVFENADQDVKQSDTTEKPSISQSTVEESTTSEAVEEKTIDGIAEEEEEYKKLRKRRMSKKKSTRTGQFASADESRVSGDFTVMKKNEFGSAASPSSITSFYVKNKEEEGEEGEEEERMEEEVEEVSPINRDYYYSLYRKLLPERNTRRIKNNFLQRKMAEYFKKRKMEHVLKETDQQVDSQQKYEKKLEALADLKELDVRERNSITAELNDLRLQKDEHQDLFNTHFTSMQHREKDIGSGLINTKTGKPLSDKVVERLIKRQKDKMLEIATMRLVYIKLRNLITEKKVAIHKLDTIGDNLHLIDYEQLKMENTSHTDKIEERDEELVKLRVKCSGSMQCLAHVREKSAALQLDLMQLTDQYEEVKDEALNSRERLNGVKQERDNYRLNIGKIIDESGLLTKPKLLIDMEESLEEIKILENQIDHLKKQYEKTRESLKAIKINMKNMQPRKTYSKKTRGDSKLKVPKGRPTIVCPSLPSL